MTRYQTIHISLIAAVLVAGCGRDNAAPSPTTTTTTVTATAGPSTTEPHYTREALEAIQRCLDATDDTLTILAQLEAELGRTDSIDEAIELCKEAQLQIAVDNDLRLKAPVQHIVSALSLAGLGVEFMKLGGETEPDWGRLQADCDKFAQLAADAISGVNFD